MPVIALLNQKGGVGKTTLSLHVAAALGLAGAKVLLVDADEQASALDWSAQRTAEPLFRVLGLPKAVLHREVPPISRDFDWVVIDGPPSIREIARSAVAASDIVLIPVQPSPFDIWAAQAIVDIATEAMIHKPDLQTRFLLNRHFPNTTLGKEVNDALAGFDFPTLQTVIHNRTEYAKSAKNGLTALETEPNGAAAREILALRDEILALNLSPKKKKEKSHAVVNR